MTEHATLADVHAHVRRPDLASEPGFQPDSEPKSARTGATRDARVIQLRPGQGQEELPKKGPWARNPLAGEAAAAQTALREAAEKSDYNRPLITPIEAGKKILPAKGEAGNPAAWIGMTIAGMLQFLILGTGYLVAQAGATRLRATIATLVVAAAMIAGLLAGNA